MSESATDKDKPGSKPDTAASAAAPTTEKTTAVTSPKSQKSTQKGGGGKKPPVTKSTRRATGTWLGLLAIVLALASAAGSYYLWKQQGAAEQSVGQSTAQLAAQQQQLQTTLDETRGTLEQLRSELDTRLGKLDERQGSLQDQLTTLLNRTGRLRNDWLVAEAEYLIRLANHRLLLDRDVATALVALKAADQRVRETGDPALLPARNALARDIQSLESVKKLDIAGVSAQLSALAGSVDKLPLATPDPASVHADKADAATVTAAEQPAADESKHWWDSFSNAWEVFRGLIVVRQHDQPVQPLLPPEQRYFLTQNLQLQLEQARIALLRGEAAVYKERIRQAQKWIRQFFDLENGTTRAMLDKLQALSKQDVAPPLPDITGALNALAEYRRARENARGNTQ